MSNTSNKLPILEINITKSFPGIQAWVMYV